MRARCAVTITSWNTQHHGRRGGMGPDTEMWPTGLFSEQNKCSKSLLSSSDWCFWTSWALLWYLATYQGVQDDFLPRLLSPWTTIEGLAGASREQACTLGLALSLGHGPSSWIEVTMLAAGVSLPSIQVTGGTTSAGLSSRQTLHVSSTWNPVKRWIPGI